MELREAILVGIGSAKFAIIKLFDERYAVVTDVASITTVGV